MAEEVIIQEFVLRSLGEMVAEILRNEDIEAHLMGTSFLNTAYLAEAGLISNDGVGWRLMVPADSAHRAREIIEELHKAGEMDFDDAPPIPDGDE